MFLSPPPAPGPVAHLDTFVPLCAQDSAQRPGKNALAPLGKDELLGDELPRGFAHDQVRHRALAPVSTCADLRLRHQLHLSRQCYHESRGPFLQKDVGPRFAAKRPLCCTEFILFPPSASSITRSGLVFFGVFFFLSFPLVLCSIPGIYKMYLDLNVRPCKVKS